MTAPIFLDLKTVKEEVEKDERLQKILTELRGEQEQMDGKFKIHNGMLRYKDRLVVSKSSKLMPAILQGYHDSAVGSLRFSTNL